jgi:hypothetical protein
MLVSKERKKNLCALHWNLALQGIKEDPLHDKLNT